MWERAPDTFAITVLERDAMQTKYFKFIYHVLADKASSFCSWNSTHGHFTLTPLPSRVLSPSHCSIPSIPMCRSSLLPHSPMSSRPAILAHFLEKAAPRSIRKRKSQSTFEHLLLLFPPDGHIKKHCNLPTSVQHWIEDSNQYLNFRSKTHTVVLSNRDMIHFHSDGTFIKLEWKS